MQTLRQRVITWRLCQKTPAVSFNALFDYETTCEVAFWKASNFTKKKKLFPSIFKVLGTSKTSWLQNMWNWNIVFFFIKLWVSYNLNLAETEWTRRILAQKAIRNFRMKELWALENHVYLNMLLYCTHFTEVY